VLGHETLNVGLERLVPVERNRLHLQPDRADSLEVGACPREDLKLGALDIEMDQVDLINGLLPTDTLDRVCFDLDLAIESNPRVNIKVTVRRKQRARLVSVVPVDGLDPGWAPRRNIEDCAARVIRQCDVEDAHVGTAAAFEVSLEEHNVRRKRLERIDSRRRE
jgi:hypothetical protein